MVIPGTLPRLSVCLSACLRLSRLPPQLVCLSSCSGHVCQSVPGLKACLDICTSTVLRKTLLFCSFFVSTLGITFKIRPHAPRLPVWIDLHLSSLTSEGSMKFLSIDPSTHFSNLLQRPLHTLFESLKKILRKY